MQTGGGQVSDDLSHFLIGEQVGEGFYLNYNQVFYFMVEVKSPNPLLVIIKLKVMFLRNEQIVGQHFSRHRFLVMMFLQARAKPGVNSHGAADNAIS